MRKVIVLVVSIIWACLFGASLLVARESLGPWPPLKSPLVDALCNAIGISDTFLIADLNLVVWALTWTLAFHVAAFAAWAVARRTVLR